jgi:amidase
MGRTVGDVALFLDTQAHQAAVDPTSMPAPAKRFVDAVDNPVAPKRIAYTSDLGIAPVDAEVRTICAEAIKKVEEMGVEVDGASIDFSDAEDIFQTLRAAQYAAQYGPLLARHRDVLKPDIVWNIEKGQSLSSEDVNRAELARGALYNRTAAFFGQYDLLVSPTVLVPPFDVDQPYVTEVGGTRFDNYVSWLMMSFAITLTACPAISVPCGFTESGLPVGLQIVAPRAQEARLLSAAALFEKAAALRRSVPIDPVVRHTEAG